MAMDKLPQMTERKKKIDMHFKIASRILSEIKSRSIDKLQDIEDELLTTKKLAGENKQDLDNILSLEVAGGSQDNCSQFFDKLRILTMIIIVSEDLSLMT